MTHPYSPRIAVIGATSCTAQEEATAEEVGRRLAKAGAVLLTGGRGGVMATDCRGQPLPIIHVDNAAEAVALAVSRLAPID